MASSSVTSDAPPTAKTLLDLPSEVLGQCIVAHPDLDAASRLALFRTSHALARMVLLHAPGSKQLTAEGSRSGGRWSSTLVRLLGTKWQPLHLADLQLKVTSLAGLRRPPAAISQQLFHLHLYKCSLTVNDLVAWQLHDTTLWPHLQRLTIMDCSSSTTAHTNMRQLQPIPLLRSLTWYDYEAGEDEGSEESEGEESPPALAHQASQAALINALTRLAAHATHANLQLFYLFSRHPGIMVLEQLQHLTHIDVGRADKDWLEALLQHPTLEHVTLGSTGPLESDLSQKACWWRTLTVGWAGVKDLGRLPLANLERLTISGHLSAWMRIGVSAEEQQAAAAAGMALLQQLHSGGRLVLLPEPDDGDNTRMWQLQPGSGLFSLQLNNMVSCMPALVRLVLEVGQGISALELSGEALFQQEVVPQLQHSGTIHTLCINRMPEDVSGEGWAVWFGALPTCVTNVKVDINVVSHLPPLRALVQGAVAALARPLTLTLLHQGSIVCDPWEAELMQLAAGSGMDGLGGGGGGGAGVQGAPLLTLEVVRATSAS